MRGYSALPRWQQYGMSMRLRLERARRDAGDACGLDFTFISYIVNGPDVDLHSSRLLPSGLGVKEDDDQRERDQELIGKPLEEQLRREPAQTAEENADETPSVILAVVMLMPSFY